MKVNIRRTLDYLSFGFKFMVLRQDVPFILGFVPTNKCNLNCKSCRVANTGIPDMSMDEVRGKLALYFERGFRELYIEGGEPFLWRDGEYRLDDIVHEAQRIGYFHTHVYTNGMFPLEGDADLYWVSVDGMKQGFADNRGDHFERVLSHIKAAADLNIVIIFTVNAFNRGQVEEFLRFVQQELRIVGVIFYFHTPYYGKDELFLDKPERGEIIDELLRLKRKGLPVFNSAAALKALKSGRWKRPSKTWIIVDTEREYVCCRAPSPEACEHCGYSACTEITEAQRLAPSAIFNLVRMM